MNDEQKKQPEGESKNLVVSQDVILLREFIEALSNFMDLTKASYSNVLNNSDDLDAIAKIHNMALKVRREHVSIQISLLESAFHRDEVAHLKQKLRQSECLLRYFSDYQSDIENNVVRDLSNFYHQDYEN